MDLAVAISTLPGFTAGDKVDFIFSNELCVCVCESDCIYRLWVGQWAEPVVVFLSSCIPEAQVDRLAVHHHIS